MCIKSLKGKHHLLQCYYAKSQFFFWTACDSNILPKVFVEGIFQHCMVMFNKHWQVLPYMTPLIKHIPKILDDVSVNYTFSVETSWPCLFSSLRCNVMIQRQTEFSIPIIVIFTSCNTSSFTKRTQIQLSVTSFMKWQTWCKTWIVYGKLLYTNTILSTLRIWN